MRDYLIVFIISALIRLPFLGTYPPSGPDMTLRIVTAVLSIFSIVLFQFILNRGLRDNKLALWSALALAFMPWHIEQSRIYSPPIWALTIAFFGIVLVLRNKNKIVRIGIFTLTTAMFLLVYPEFLFKDYQLLPTREVISHMFHFISGEFLFFKNETFWSGGLRTVGVMLPSLIPLFFLGTIEGLKRIKTTHLRFLFLCFGILILSSLNPLLPEGREFLMITPYFSLILGFGVLKVLEYLKGAKMLKKTLMALYLMFIFYDYILFFHAYTVHYTHRFRQEIPYAEISF